MKKIAFRLNSDKAVEYANAHNETGNGDYGRLPGDTDMFFHIPALRSWEGAQHLYHNYGFPLIHEGYTDVTENFERDYYWPWKDMLDNCRLGEKCTCIKQTYTGCYNYALNKNEKIHIPLKNIDGHITVSKSVGPEIIEALNKMAELAYQSLTPIK